MNDCESLARAILSRRVAYVALGRPSDAEIEAYIDAEQPDVEALARCDAASLEVLAWKQIVFDALQSEGSTPSFAEEALRRSIAADGLRLAATVGYAL